MIKGDRMRAWLTRQSPSGGTVQGIDRMVGNIQTGHFERSLAGLTAAGALGSLFVFARRRGPQPQPPGQRPAPDDRMLAAGTLLAMLSAVAVVLASDVFEFSWRYQLPALVTLPLAGVLGGTLIAGRVRLGRAPRPAKPEAQVSRRPVGRVDHS